MRQLHDHEINDFNTDTVKVLVLDEPDDKTGGACHEYLVVADRGAQVPAECRIKFQHGAIKEHGVNGISNEALISVVIDRIRCFQRGPFSCRENAVMLTKLEEAMMWGHKRTLDRVRRDVEGKNEK